MLIHNGTILQSSFSLVDSDGNVVKTFTVSPQQGKPDPLLIQVLKQEKFIDAFLALDAIRSQLLIDIEKEQG